MAPETNLLDGFPKAAPSKPTKQLNYADVSHLFPHEKLSTTEDPDQPVKIAVTATAKDFAGIYRNKQYHAPDFPAALDRAKAAGVEKIMLTGMSPSDVPINLAHCVDRPNQCSLTIGIHPYHAGEPDTFEGGEEAYFSHFMDEVRRVSALKPSPLAAYGELGLDYDRVNLASKEAQMRTFKRQLDLFVKEKLDLPLFLHCRAAFEDFVEVMKPYVSKLPRSGLVHSFVGTSTQMRALVDLGLDVSVNAFAFSDRDSLEMIRDTPLDHLHIETDAPWGEVTASSDVAKRYLVAAEALPPSKKRDKFEMGFMVKGRNESCLIERVAFVVAGLRGVSVEVVAEAAWRNSMRMFRLEEQNQ